MGWYFDGAPRRRRDYIAELTAPRDWIGVGAAHTSVEYIAHCWRGNMFSGVLWSVVQITVELPGVDIPPYVSRFISCDIMKCHNQCWGHKPIDETMGPCEVSCPLGYLELAPYEPVGSYAGPWREKVRQYHANRKKEKSRG